MNNSIYCSGWFRARKKVTELYANEKARTLHVSREFYGVVIEKDKQPYCFLEINDTFVLVGFLDNLQREYLTYQFSEIEPEKLFLKHAQYWKYEGNTDEKIFSTRYFFSPDGTLKIEKVNIRTNDAEIFHAKEPVDITANHEKYPDFGQYEKLIKKERLTFPNN